MIAVLFLLLGALPLGAEPRQVLVLHAYGRDMAWTEEIHQGIVEAFEDPSEVEWRVDYLDTKHRVDEAYLDELGRLLRMKYRGVTFDGILLSDNNALDFYRDHLVAHFRDVPVVAVGYNGEAPPLPEAVHVLASPVRAGRTLDLALDQNPRARRIVVVHDGTETGRAMADEVGPLLEAYEKSRGIAGTIGAFSSLDKAARFLSGRGDDEIVFLLTFFRDVEADRGVTPREAVAVLSAASPVPLYIPWTFYLGHGALGGFLLSPRRVGYEGARYLQGLWEGKAPVDPDIEEDLQSFYGADDEVMRRFGLTEGDFPDGTVFVNRPPSFYERHRTVLLASAAVIVGLLAVIALLFAALGRKNRVLRHRLELQALQKELLETQEETIDLIGDAIEGRSRETANHVRRVAEVAAFLGARAGLDPEEVQGLRRAAPLHDVGKVAISDAILAKPARLDADEFEQMKRHAALGAELLGRSRRPVLQLAALIAGTHHERWDGTGYPKGLAKEAIPLVGRLVAVADVFDALLSRRCYKEPWPADETIAYFQAERGGHFDPALVDLVVAHRDELLDLRSRYPDQDQKS